MQSDNSNDGYMMKCKIYISEKKKKKLKSFIGRESSS